MKRIRLTMVRKHLKEIPQYHLPKGFSLRFFASGDEKSWSHVETSTGEFEHEKAALNHFEEEFGNHLDEMTNRCLFLENEFGDVIGTITAWYGSIEETNEVLGRIHWVGVVPDFQGKKLSKPLLSAAMTILAEHHDAAYLTTQTTSYQAVNMYLDFGFKPLLTSETCQEGWNLMAQTLQRKIL